MLELKHHIGIFLGIIIVAYFVDLCIIPEYNRIKYLPLTISCAFMVLFEALYWTFILIFNK